MRISISNVGLVAANMLMLLSACTPAITSQPPVVATESIISETPTWEVTVAPSSTPLPESVNDNSQLDLRFANVIAVDFERLADNEVRFSVTLYHDDDGEAPNFADAWQVEDLEGNLLGRRDLLHSHGTQPFTRSHTVTIPANIETVLVRGHDMVHGFGGQAMRVELTSGETIPIQSKAGP